MASDDNERKRGRAVPLPPSVAAALAEARARAQKAGPPRGAWFWRARREETGKGPIGKSPIEASARGLALVPVIVALLTLLLMLPRAAPPEDVPVPEIDGAALRVIVAADVTRAAKARTTRLPGELLAVGSAVRAINKAQATGASSEDVVAARILLDSALRDLGAVEPKAMLEGLKTLRAVQLESFLAEIERFEATGSVTSELEELGGAFVDRMLAAGWIAGHRVLLDDDQRRAAFKLVWTAMVGAEHAPELQLALDEQRALYTLYVTRPHAPENQRAAFEAMRRAATTETECARTIVNEQTALELWRADKIKKLGELDPRYPTDYALGVAYYRAGRFDLSMEAFRRWMEKHPDGTLALRAQNHLKAALSAYGPS